MKKMETYRKKGVGGKNTNESGREKVMKNCPNEKADIQYSSVAIGFEQNPRIRGIKLLKVSK